jgi:hypothetical protein
MAQIGKLYAQLVGSRSSIRFADFERILRAFGFTLDRIKGSHHQYKHLLATRPLSIQPKGNMAKPYQVDQFLGMVQEFGLTMED